MSYDWRKCRLHDVISFNPSEKLAKGTIAKKISMDVLRPFSRDIPAYTIEGYSGGTKFRNGDTIMARITPCLENGKTALVNILDDNEVAFGSTEYIESSILSTLTLPLFAAICLFIFLNT